MILEKQLTTEIDNITTFSTTGENVLSITSYDNLPRYDRTYHKNTIAYNDNMCYYIAYSNHNAYKITFNSNQNELPICKKIDANYNIAVFKTSNGRTIFARNSTDSLRIKYDSTNDYFYITGLTAYEGKFIEYEINGEPKLILVTSDRIIAINVYSAIQANAKNISTGSLDLEIVGHYLFQAAGSGYDGYIKKLDLSATMSNWAWENTANSYYPYYKFYKTKTGLLVAYQTYTGYGSMGSLLYLNATTMDFEPILQLNPDYENYPDDEEEYVPLRGEISSIFANDSGTIFVTTSNKIYKIASVNSPAVDITADVCGSSYTTSADLYGVNNTIICRVYNGSTAFYYSTDGGNTWQINNGLLGLNNNNPYKALYYISKFNMYILCGSNGSCYSLDNLITWSTFNRTEDIAIITDEVSNNTLLFIHFYTGGTPYVMFNKISCPIINDYTSKPLTGAQAKQLVAECKAYVQGLKNSL